MPIMAGHEDVLNFYPDSLTKWDAVHSAANWRGYLFQLKNCVKFHIAHAIYTVDAGWCFPNGATGWIKGQKDSKWKKSSI